MSAFFQELSALSGEGGWLFWCLIALAFGISFSLLSIWYYLLFPNPPLISGDKWRWLVSSSTHNEKITAELQHHLPDENIADKLREIDQRLFSAAGRRIPFAFVLIGAAPLVGLLGTVSGMFSTFDGLAGVSGTRPVDVISGGVSEALITTQTGLIISIPTFIVCCILKGRYEQLRNGFQRLEASLTSGERTLRKEEVADGA